MKILLINDMATPVGGAELLTKVFREELIKRGHDTRIFSSRAEKTAGENFADYTCFGTTGQFRTVNRVFNMSAYWQLRRVIKKFKPDVVHVRMFFTQLSPAILPLLRRIPSLYHAVWYESVCPIGLKLLPDLSVCREKAGLPCFRNGCLSPQAWTILMVQLKLWQAWRNVFDLVVANSFAVKKSMNENGIEPVEVIHNGVPIRPVRASLSEPPTVAFAGRLSREKGITVLLRAFKKVVDEIPSARLLIAGEGPEKNNLNKLISQLELKSNVAILGHLSQPEMERKFKSAWVQAVPSCLAEPFGLVAAEGMMRGTAVVASSTGGLSEIVDDGQTGFLVPPNDINALAESLLRLLKDKELSEKMGSAGRIKALEQFNQTECVEKFITIYESIYKKRGSYSIDN